MTPRDRVLWLAEDADQVLGELAGALAAIEATSGVTHVQALRTQLTEYMTERLNEAATASESAVSESDEGGAVFTPFPGRRVAPVAPAPCEPAEPTRPMSASEAGRKAALTRWARVRARAAAASTEPWPRSEHTVTTDELITSDRITANAAAGGTP